MAGKGKNMNIYINIYKIVNFSFFYIWVVAGDDGEISNMVKPTMYSVFWDARFFFKIVWNILVDNV